MIITMQHVRSVLVNGKVGYCALGTRRFFRRHGLDFSRFLKEGIPEEQLLATGDAMAKRVVEFAYGRK